MSRVRVRSRQSRPIKLSLSELHSWRRTTSVCDEGAVTSRNIVYASYPDGEAPAVSLHPWPLLIRRGNITNASRFGHGSSTSAGGIIFMPNQTEKLCQTRHRISDRGDVTDGCGERPKHPSGGGGRHQHLLHGHVSVSPQALVVVQDTDMPNTVCAPLHICVGDLCILLRAGYCIGFRHQG